MRSVWTTCEECRVHTCTSQPLGNIIISSTSSDRTDPDKYWACVRRGGRGGGGWWSGRTGPGPGRWYLQSCLGSRLTLTEAEKAGETNWPSCGWQRLTAPPAVVIQSVVRAQPGQHDLRHTDHQEWSCQELQTVSSQSSNHLYYQRYIDNVLNDGEAFYLEHWKWQQE